MVGMKRFLAVFTVLVAAALPIVAGQTARPSKLIDSVALLRDLKTLSADDMQGRQVDTPGGAKARAFVIERFKASGVKPFATTYEAPFTFSGRGGQGERHGVNVVGHIDGTRSPAQYLVVHS